MSTRQCRYVIQRHTWKGFDHFDFMFEVPDSDRLRTFQLPAEPHPLACLQGISCREIASHRADYLNYEGPVSRDRGSVAIFDQGNAYIVEERSGWLRLHLASTRGIQHPEWVLRATSGSGWHLMAIATRSANL
jgi:hypothetical protein